MNNLRGKDFVGKLFGTLVAGPRFYGMKPKSSTLVFGCLVQGTANGLGWLAGSFNGWAQEVMINQTPVRWHLTQAQMTNSKPLIWFPAYFDHPITRRNMVFNPHTTMNGQSICMKVYQ